MKRRQIIQSFINFVNTFSLWVVFGSLITYWFFALIFDRDADIIVGLILALSIWIIYTLDHLLDGIKTKGNSLSLRHNLHYKFKNPLTLLITVPTLVVIYLVSQKLDYSYLGFGMLLFILTLIHFSINHFAPNQFKVKYYVKEVFIAFVVSLGFCGLPICNALPFLWSQSFILLFSSFFLLNLGNLMIFSFFDFHEDLKSEFTSSANTFGASRSLYWAKISCTCSLLLAIGIGIAFNFAVGGTLFIMNCILLVICFNEEYFQVNGYYRFWGDFIYLLPIFALPFL